MKFLFYTCLTILIYCNADCRRVIFQNYCVDGTNPEPFARTGKDSSGSIVMSENPTNETWYRPDLNCTVILSVPHDYLLLLSFSNISLRNSTMDNLTVIYNSDKSSIVLFGQQVCSNENCEGLKFDSGEFNNITLKFVSANATVPKNVTGFRAHYTVYNLVGSNAACKDRHQFLCENGHCIWNQLVCNGHNDCGDRSDETKCIIPVKDTVWGIVVIVIAVFSVIVMVPLFCCLATVGTRSIVKSVTLSSSQATPLHPTVDCGETAGLLTSSDAMNDCWPGTSYDRSGSLSYGTSELPGSSNINLGKKKFSSPSETCELEPGKL